MADMAEMEMPLPDNTVPMMTGQGPFGSVEMGGMFSVVKVRKDQKPGDYKDPGWYKHHPAKSRLNGQAQCLSLLGSRQKLRLADKTGNPCHA